MSKLAETVLVAVGTKSLSVSDLLKEEKIPGAQLPREFPEEYN